MVFGRNGLLQLACSVFCTLKCRLPIFGTQRLSQKLHLIFKAAEDNTELFLSPLFDLIAAHSLHGTWGWGQTVPSCQPLPQTCGIQAAAQGTQGAPRGAGHRSFTQTPAASCDGGTSTHLYTHAYAYIYARAYDLPATRIQSTHT